MKQYLFNLNHPLTRYWIYAIFATLSLSCEGLILRLAGTPIRDSAFLRGIFTGSAYVFLALSYYTIKPRKVTVRKNRNLQLTLALLTATNSLLFVYGLGTMSAEKIYAFTGSTPICAALFSVLLGRHRPNHRFWCSAFFCALGLAAISCCGSGWTNSGLIAAIGMALGVGMALCLLARLSNADALSAMGVGLLASSALVYATRTESISPSPTQVIWFLVLGIILMPIYVLFLLAASRRLAPHEIGAVLLGECLLAPALIWSFTGERPDTPSLLAAAIVLLSSIYYFSSLKSAAFKD